MRDFTLLEVPYHLGLIDVGVGKGPRTLLAGGADHWFGCRDIPAQVQHVSLRDKSCEGLDAVVDLNRQIRVAVRQAVEQTVVPVVLAGNCNSCLGTLAGLDPWGLGVVWLDKHPDFHTPETTISGSLEGMSLAAAVGDCHEELRARIGFADPVAAANVVVPLAWDIEPGERERFEAAGFATDLTELAGRVESVYLHLDTDCIDPAAPEVAEHWVRTVMTEMPVAAVAVTNYNPDTDEDWRRLAAITRVVRAIAG